MCATLVSLARTGDQKCCACSRIRDLVGANANDSMASNSILICADYKCEIYIPRAFGLRQRHIENRNVHAAGELNIKRP